MAGHIRQDQNMITLSVNLSRLIEQQNSPDAPFSERENQIMRIAVAAQREADQLAIALGRAESIMQGYRYAIGQKNFSEKQSINT
jgi:hypothetical protein